jgi:hypothetical protein
MHFRYTLTSDDLERFYDYYLANSGLIKVLHFIVHWGTPFVFLYFGLKGNTLMKIAMASAAGIWVILYPYRKRVMTSRKFNNVAFKGINEKMVGPIELEFTPEMIIEKTRSSVHKAYWRSIKPVKTDDHIFIFVNSFSAAILPRHAFHSDEEFSNAFDEATRYAKASKA